MLDQELEKMGEGLDFSHLSKATTKEKIIIDEKKLKKEECKPIPAESFKPMEYDRENYDNYLFRPSSFGRLVAGQPKPLTEDQKSTLQAYTARFHGDGKPLTEKQEITYHNLCIKKAESEKVILSKGAKTMLEDIVRQDKFGRSKAIETKYMDKGLVMEDASIELYGGFIGQELKKNTERKSNKYWIGECDNQQGKIRDFKTSWDFTTFPATETEIENSLYEWQLQCYMDLYGFEEAELIYCLVDTPTRFIEDELKRLDYQYDILNFSGDVREEAIPFVVEKVSNMVYTIEGICSVCEQSSILEIEWFVDKFISIPVEDRIKVFKTTKKDEMIKLGKKVIILARNYMNELIAKEPKTIEVEEVVEEVVEEPKSKFTFNF